MGKEVPMSAADSLQVLREAWEAAPHWPGGMPKGLPGRIALIRLQSSLVDACPEIEALIRAADKALDDWDHQSTERACWTLHLDVRAARAALEAKLR
jgi:hypothetical protein